MFTRSKERFSFCHMLTSIAFAAWVIPLFDHMLNAIQIFGGFYFTPQSIPYLRS